MLRLPAALSNIFRGPRLTTQARAKREALLSVLFVAAMVALCAVLAVLQYRWVGEVSVAARERLRTSLETSLNRLGADLNAEILGTCRLFLPQNMQNGVPELEREIAGRFDRLRKFNHRANLFARIALAVPGQDSVVLHALDFDRAAFHSGPWPESWKPVEEQVAFRGHHEPWRNGGSSPAGDSLVFEFPLFGMVFSGNARAEFGAPPEPVWLIIELDRGYVRDVLVPDLLKRHLGDGKTLEYQAAVLTSAKDPKILYESDPGVAKTIGSTADASIELFDIDSRQLAPRPSPERSLEMQGRTDGVRPPPGMFPKMAGKKGPGMGMAPPFADRRPVATRWQLFVRHRAGSLEAVVSRARWRNLGVAGGVLLLLMASLAALVRFTRRAQKLAQLQMEFVAGVSHELRTPLTVIHTAGYNLRGKVAQNPSQVERYGALIQQESGRLKELVEQILLFARVEAGKGMHRQEPFSVGDVIADVIEGERTAAQSAGCRIDASVDPGLPLVLGDSVALRHAVGNLVNNALKYGTEGGNWIGVSAAKVNEDGHDWVELRVADRGPGIPHSEQGHIFDPFFRGRRAREDQVHGSGLGLNLVMRIVRAHGGTVGVNSEPTKGAEFVVRLPAARPEFQDEFANSAG